MAVHITEHLRCTQYVADFWYEFQPAFAITSMRITHPKNIRTTENDAPSLNLALLSREEVASYLQLPADQECQEEAS